MGARNFTHVFDGYAKLNKITFGADGLVTYSCRFVQTDFYQDSIQESDVASYILFDRTSPTFGILKKARALQHGIDHTNVNILRLQDTVMVNGDFWLAHEINPTTLETLTRIDPHVPGMSFWRSLLPVPTPSTAHPVREFNSDTYISFATILNPIPLMRSSINVVRLRSALERELVATIPRDASKVPYMHSFALSPRYAIIFANPLFIDWTKIVLTATGLNALNWYGNQLTDIYVVQIDNGRFTKMTTDAMLNVHHVNSYEVDNKIIIDFTTLPNPDLFKEYLLPTLLNPNLRDSIRVNSTLRRFTIDLKIGTVSCEDFPETPGVEYASHFEMPVINEDFRHRRHCYIYGIATKTDGRHLATNALVKKDVCRPGRDRAWSKPNHYVSEPHFVPRPNSIREDDGTLICIILDGENKLSYVGIFNPETMELETVGYLPHIVPTLLHGHFFTDLWTDSVNGRFQSTHRLIRKLSDLLFSTLHVALPPGDGGFNGYCHAAERKIIRQIWPGLYRI